MGANMGSEVQALKSEEQEAEDGRKKSEVSSQDQAKAAGRGPGIDSTKHFILSLFTDKSAATGSRRSPLA
jgi:hypothetical protein